MPAPSAVEPGADYTQLNSIFCNLNTLRWTVSRTPLTWDLPARTSHVLFSFIFVQILKVWRFSACVLVWSGTELNLPLPPTTRWDFHPFFRGTSIWNTWCKDGIATSRDNLCLYLMGLPKVWRQIHPTAASLGWNSLNKSLSLTLSEPFNHSRSGKKPTTASATSAFFL